MVRRQHGCSRVGSGPGPALTRGVLLLQIIRVQSPEGVKRITATKRETVATFLKKVPGALQGDGDGPLGHGYRVLAKKWQLGLTVTQESLEQLPVPKGATSRCIPDPHTQAQLLCCPFTEVLLTFCFVVGHRSPPARSGHRCVADNANLYVFGGYNPDYEESGGPENEDYPLFRELWRYNFATDTWHQMSTEGYMPRELASMSRTYGNSIPVHPLLKLF